MYEAVREIFKDAFAKERQEGLQDGINADKERVAIDMLKESYPIKAIIKISQLSEEAIRKIAISLNLTIAN